MKRLGKVIVLGQNFKHQWQHISSTIRIGRVVSLSFALLVGLALFVGPANSESTEKFTYTTEEVKSHLIKAHSRTYGYPKWITPIRYKFLDLAGTELQEEFHRVVNNARTRFGIDIKLDDSPEHSGANLIIVVTNDWKKAFFHPLVLNSTGSFGGKANAKADAEHQDRENQHSPWKYTKHNSAGGMNKIVAVMKPHLNDPPALTRLINTLIYSSFYRIRVSKFWPKSIWSGQDDEELLAGPTPFDVALLAAVYDRDNPLPHLRKGGLQMLITRVLDDLKKQGALSE